MGENRVEGSIKRGVVEREEFGEHISKKKLNIMEELAERSLELPVLVFDSLVFRDESFDFLYICFHINIIIIHSFHLIDKSSMIQICLSLLLASIVHSLYIPELLIASSSSFLNKKIASQGPKIIDKIYQKELSPISYDDTVDGVHIKFNLTHLRFKEKPEINWNASVVNITDEHSFSINSKNITLKLNASIEFKIGIAPKQKGTLLINITKLETDTALSFKAPSCSGGVGFDIQIDSIFVHTEKIDIKIEGKTLDNVLIKAIIAALNSRLPNIINNLAQTAVNPLITSITCEGVQDILQVGTQSYVAIANTTEVPNFKGQNLYFLVDLTLKNEVTNKSNPEVENDNLPMNNIFQGKADATVVASSNMINTLLWVIDDSHLLEVNVTNKDLGPAPPILLNTTNLSILLPGITKWKNKEVVLLVEPSNTFSSLFVRNGKISAVLSVSIKFVVYLTGDSSTYEVHDCIKSKDCVVGCNLNITIPFSAALYIESGALLKGLIHNVGIEKLEVISSQFDIDLQVTRTILSTLINSFRPQGNKIVQEGVEIPLDIKQLKPYNLTNLMMRVKKDYINLGVSME